MRPALWLSLFALIACGGDGAMDGGPDALPLDAPLGDEHVEAGLDSGRDAGEIDLSLPDASDGGESDANCLAAGDEDGDGHLALRCGGDDCDDLDPDVHPGALEVCDATGRDEDCDPATLGRDADGDGSYASTCCNRSAGGALVCGDDCDDRVATVGPGATEVCNRIDDDCDGSVDEGVGVTCWVDADRDGYAPVAAAHAVDCFCGDGRTARDPAAGADCDDADALRSPGSPEVCDGVDDDCDGSVDEVTTASWYADCDGDVHGSGVATSSCAAPAVAPASCPAGAWTPLAGDCDDGDSSRHPAAIEACNGIDDDCDAVVDGAGAAAWCTARAPGGVAYASCVAGACGVAACATGRVDCNGGDDCEVDCTSCGEACSWSCDAPLCDGVIAINVGNNHSCAVRASGSVYCWGKNDNGQLGDGMLVNRDVPTHVVGIADAIEVAAGLTFTCVLRSGGTVACFGGNTLGELGDGDPARTVPGADVPGVSGGVQIVAAESHTCVLSGAGTVTCWGDGLAPSVVSGLPVMDAIDAGSTMDCGIRHGDSVVMCWGRGALGDGTYYASDVAAVVVGGATPLVATDLGIGTITACAVDDVGAVWCWGSNLNGMLGDGMTTHSGDCGGMDCATLPVRVSGITTAVNVALGWHTGCARLTSGEMWCWGFNGAYCLGSGGPMTMVSNVPLHIAMPNDFSAVVAKDLHFCAQRSPGGLECWGLNLFGELGDGTTMVRSVPVAVLHP